MQIGSITGGGHYGMSGVSGVGISFGADRIFDVLNQLDLYRSDGTQLLFINFGEKGHLNEMNEEVTLKNMETGGRKMVTPQELVSD